MFQTDKTAQVEREMLLSRISECRWTGSHCVTTSQPYVPTRRDEDYVMLWQAEYARIKKICISFQKNRGALIRKGPLRRRALNPIFKVNSVRQARHVHVTTEH